MKLRFWLNYMLRFQFNYDYKRPDSPRLDDHIAVLRIYRTKKLFALKIFLSKKQNVTLRNHNNIYTELQIIFKSKAGGKG